MLPMLPFAIFSSEGRDRMPNPLRKKEPKEPLENPTRQAEREQRELEVDVFARLAAFGKSLGGRMRHIGLFTDGAGFEPGTEISIEEALSLRHKQEEK